MDIKKKRLRHLISSTVVCIMSLYFPSVPASAAVTGERLTHADADPGNWMSYGRDYSEQRFSPLKEIDTNTVEKLGLDWSYTFSSKRGLEATPLMIDGTLFVTGVWSTVYAFDAKSGALLWEYDPKVNRDVAPLLCCDAVNRGVAAYGDSIFVGTLDGRLISLDAKSGQVNWDVQTTDQSKPYSITGAPRVVKGNVIIGNGGAEYGVRGYVSAYDAISGKLNWRFYTVPGNPQIDDDFTTRKASDSWNGEWWKLGGGGTVWDSIVYDSEAELLYIGVGNGSPWNQKIRSPGGGDNLFLSSIVALKPDTGEYVWHFQTTPGEEWDYTAAQPMILADLEINGKNRKVIMQAPKNGFFYVLDRTTGEFISANNYTAQNWAESIDPVTGRPTIKPEARYSQTGKPYLMTPSFLGGHSWQSMSFNPETGLAYFPTRQMSFPYIDEPNFKFNPMGVNLGIDGVAASMPEDPATRKAIRAATKGRLVAWDPVNQKEVWGIDKPVPWNGGTLSTAGGLLFQGDAKGFLRAYDAKSGKELWSFFAQTGIVAAPMTYSIDGEQYVAIMAGWGGVMPLLAGELVKEAEKTRTNRLLVFKLNGTKQLEPLKTEKRAISAPESTATAEEIEAGKALYHTYCISCHGDSVVNGGVTPDLRYAEKYVYDAWEGIVLYGAKRDQGMAAFSPVLSQKQALEIRAYVIKRANDEKLANTEAK
jgi:quinohemoprotein ethanol dehydrogenase